MEWPKHYTSEKVLVLMTYTEMMNRKHGREMSSHIKPLRWSHKFTKHKEPNCLSTVIKAFFIIYIHP